MMRRVCMEAQPVRVIDQVGTRDGLFELFAQALRFLKPDVIKHILVANQESPSESVFQYELYASIRGMFQKHRISCNVLAEARYPGGAEDLTSSSVMV